ncbi:hypothetical protein BDV25DRAFT_43161 [Aspergillus avenaceus]|uniref:Uncharacterized protein n=1 Tax=Aspergillus avenaceus TaxID=36643 RepID=A0A5N6TLI9_ASPAV|nr:hypothetical protein BDV25DRAFT_43161 [Aspergillus avenaceus]
MAATHLDATSRGFADEDFAVGNFDDYPSNFCTLKNENLFPISKFPMFRKKDTPATRNAYTLIQPALLLISRIINQHWECFAIFVRRRSTGHPDTWPVDVELELPKDEIVGCIKSAIPDIDFDPDMQSDSSSFAETILCPKAKSDLIILDYNIIRLLKDSTANHTQKLAGLVFLAVLLGHEIAHLLEFRRIRAGQLRSDSEPFETPPGVTCREAGTAWQTRTFGGRIYPVCNVENSLLTIRGLCIKSSAWNFDMMKLNEDWMRQLFTEPFWTIVPPPTLRPPIDKYAQFAIIVDDLYDEQSGSPIKSKVRNNNVHCTGSPRKKLRPIIPVNTCGGKRVLMD